MDLEHGLEQVLDDLVLVLLARLLDLLYASLGLLVGFVLGLLVPLGVLSNKSVYQCLLRSNGGYMGDGERITSASNFLNSSSFFAR